MNQKTRTLRHDKCTNVLPFRCFQQIALFPEIENDDRKLLITTEGKCGLIHHLQVLLNCILNRKLFKLFRLSGFPGITIVDPINIRRFEVPGIQAPVPEGRRQNPL